MKKILAVVLALLLILGMLSGCGFKNPDLTSRELFELGEKSLHELINKEMAIDLQLDLGDMGTDFGIHGPIGAEINLKQYDENSLQLAMEIGSGSGMFVEVDAYITDEEVLIHAPFLEYYNEYEYYRLKMDAVTDETGLVVQELQTEEFQAILRDFEEGYGSEAYDLLTYEDSIEELEISVQGENVDVRKVLVSMDYSKVKAYVKAFVDYLVNHETALKTIFETSSPEDADEMVESFKAEVSSDLLEFYFEMLDLKTMSMEMSLDDDDQVVQMFMVMDVMFSDGFMSTDIKGDIMVDVYNYGGVEKIIVPEVDEEYIYDLGE